MFIQTETTPNPATLKFIPGCTVMDTGTASFGRPDDAWRSPLALRLFEIDGVAGVFLGSDFVTVSKMPNREWEVMKPQILAAIMDHFTAGEPVLTEGAAIDDGGEGDDEISAKIRELIETRVRPAVAQDGGDILFRSFEDGVVYLHMQGSCAGCPSSTLTLKMGIENLLRHYIPEVREVRPVAA